MQYQRILSLDILRGITVALMIFVNNVRGESFEMLQHSRWNGMTLCDLVFPLFLFIMGVSCYLSLTKSDFRPTPQMLCHVVKRTVLLFAIGLFINWFEYAIRGDLLSFGTLRIWAVLQRIALCYFFVSIFALYCRHRYVIPLVVALLVIYAAILVFGNGYACDASLNILAQTDLKLFGYNHLYHMSPVDPEGLLGTIPSVAHVLLGFFCGRLIWQQKTIDQKVISLFVSGAVLVLSGYLLSFGLPLNKYVWSPSFVLVTCGLSFLLQALLMVAIDYSSSNKTVQPTIFRFFKIFGMNALALYVSSELLAILLGNIGVSMWVYNAIHCVVSPQKWASLVYSICFVLINYLIGYFLYYKKIFIKL